MAKRKNIPEGQYLKGLQDIVDSLQMAVDNLERGSVQGLADALLFVGTESQQRAPVDIGDLRGSLEISVDDDVLARGHQGGGMEVVSSPPERGTIGKISYNTPYAANQHEHVEYEHPKGGQAKYLESVLVENRDRILQLIAGGLINSPEVSGDD